MKQNNLWKMEAKAKRMWERVNFFPSALIKDYFKNFQRANS